MAGKTFDRASQDLGNIIFLEHLNVRIQDQRLATLFYVAGLGFTRDPYLMVSVDNMWVNHGQTQFHLITGNSQKIRGYADMVVPDLDALTARLAEVKPHLQGTAFTYSLEDKYVAATCPWGNRFRCHAPGPEFGETTLGLARVEFPVPVGNAAGIARFYETVMRAPATVSAQNGHATARVQVGNRQELVFRETTAPIPAYENYHIAIYVADFSGPHRQMVERGILSEESNPYQYRFNDIVDVDTNKVLYTVEHEVRSATHPMFMRPLVNRNAAQRQPTYQRGRDAFVPGMV
ncbi:MAG TPA: hypothetical protein VMT79_22360 [Candidatus Binatia bacterium]|nr:hypothetical protein [Candidatus Binatia bacterium]